MKPVRTATVIAAMALVLSAGCGPKAREAILPYLFDGVASDHPVTNPPMRRVRRDLMVENDRLRRELAEAEAALKARDERAHAAKHAPPIEQAKSWDEAVKLLPTDAAGSPDWVAAITKGVIRPRPSPDPDQPEQAVLDMDIPLPSPGKTFAVVYPHAAHTRWLACGNCHPAIFPLSGQAGPIAITMAKIRAGQYCGACHGKVAFRPERHCARCHRAVPAVATWKPADAPAKPIEAARTAAEALKLIPATADGAPDWAAALAKGIIAPRAGVDPRAEDETVLPLEVVLTPKDSPDMKAVFPHETHTTILSCETCHPAIFQMSAGADPIDMEKIGAGEYCGRCHGKVAFAVETGCPRCHPGLR